MAKVVKNNIGNFFVICLIFIIMMGWFFFSFDKSSIKASPAEALTNGTFTGGTTGWTLSVTTYDDTTYYGGTAGSIRTQTTVGRNKTATGTCIHNDAITTGASDTVILNLWWKKTYTGTGAPDIHTISVQIQSSGGDWSTPTTIWTHTTVGTFDWTQVSNLDVSGYFGSGNYDYRYFMDLENPNEGDAQTTAWIDETSLDITVGAVASVVVEDGVVEYGTVPTSGTRDTLASDLNDEQSAGNNGGGTETLTIAGQNSANWTLGTTAGNETYVHWFSTDETNPANWTALSTSYLTLDTSLADGQTQDFHLRIQLPTSTNYYTEQNVTVTVQASLE